MQPLLKGPSIYEIGCNGTGNGPAQVVGARGRRGFVGYPPTNAVRIERRRVLWPGCSGDHAVDDNVDGEAKPFVAIAGDHLRSVGDEERESLGW